MIGIPLLRENNRRYLGRYSHPSIVIWYWSPVAHRRPVSITCNSSAISSRIYEKLIAYSQQIDSSGRMELCIPVSFGLMSAQPNKTACLSYNSCMPNSSRIRQSLTDAFWKRIDDVAQRFSNFIANSLELPQSCIKPSICRANVWKSNYNQFVIKFDGFRRMPFKTNFLSSSDYVEC